MKKLLVLVVAALFTMNMSAEKGSMYLGLTGVGAFEGLGTGFMINGDYTTLGVAPEFGYFVSDNLAVGAIFGISSESLKNRNDNPFYFGFNPYARYFVIQDGDFGFYLQGNVKFLTETSAKTNTFGINIAPGISYNVGPFTATAAFGWLGFETTSYDGPIDSDNRFGLSLKMSSLNFGLSYNF